MKKVESGKEKRKGLFQRLSSIITGVVFFLALAAVLALVIQSAGGKNPSLFGYKFYYIATDSMEPSLQVNDVILSQVLSPSKDGDHLQYIENNVKEGDVVTFTAEYGVQRGLNITHKVVKGVHYNEEYNRFVITTQGTKFGATEDPPVPVENIQAVMVRKVGFISVIYNFATSVTGLIVMIVAPAAAMLAILVIRLIRIAMGKSPVIDEERKKEIEKEIAEKAVKEYEEYLQKKKAIEEAAIKEYKERSGK